jgi:hypothetical protein
MHIYIIQNNRLPNIAVEWYSYFIFGRFWVQISAWRPAILAEVFMVFLSFQADAEVAP